LRYRALLLVRLLVRLLVCLLVLMLVQCCQLLLPLLLQSCQALLLLLLLLLLLQQRHAQRRWLLRLLLHATSRCSLRSKCSWWWLRCVCELCGGWGLCQHDTVPLPGSLSGAHAGHLPHTCLPAGERLQQALQQQAADQWVSNVAGTAGWYSCLAIA
jgi:hypothetical protein